MGRIPGRDPRAPRPGGRRQYRQSHLRLAACQESASKAAARRRKRRTEAYREARALQKGAYIDQRRFISDPPTPIARSTTPPSWRISASPKRSRKPPQEGSDRRLPVAARGGGTSCSTARLLAMRDQRARFIGAALKELAPDQKHRPIGEKALEQVRGRLFESRNRPPARGGMSAAEEPDAVVDRAALRVFRAVVQPADARERDGRGAHGAGFQRHIEIGAGQPLLSRSASQAMRIAAISACAVTSLSSRVRLPERPITLPSRTTTAPMGTSPRSPAAQRLLERHVHKPICLHASTGNIST